MLRSIDGLEFKKDGIPTWLFPIMSGNAVRVFSILLLVPTFFLLIPMNVLRFIMGTIMIVMIPDAIYVIVKGQSFLLDARTAFTGFAACLMPLLLTSKFKSDWAIAAILLASILWTTDGATGYAVLGVTAVSYLIATRRESQAAIISLIGLSMVLLKFKVSEFGGRIEMWAEFLKFFKANVNPFLGVGSGGTEMLGFHIKSKVPNSLLHNEFVHNFVDNGVIGTIAFLVLIGYFLWISFRRKPEIFSFFMGYLTLSMTYTPLRYFVSLFVLLGACRMVLDEVNQKFT